MLLATPGQTTATAYSTLHNNTNNNTGSNSTTTTNASTTRKQTAVNMSSASANHPPVNNKQNNLSSTTTSSTSSSASSASLSSSCIKSNNINSLKNHNSFHFQSPSALKNVCSSNDTKTTNNPQQQLPQQHSLKTTDNSKSLSFINSLKDTVQKVFVTTATTPSLARNCNQTNNNITTTSSTIKTTNSTNSDSGSTVNHYNTSKTSTNTTTSYSNINVTSSSSSTTPVASTSSINVSAAVARKKSVSQNLGVKPRLHTIPPTILHRCPEERQKTSSTDSLGKEMCHFKPIRKVPTTPWKSGSKSRGSSLRFPKANLATRTNEFILKSNCDVNNRQKKKISVTKVAPNERNETADIVAGDNNNEEQENREYYEHFKPKPSTLHLFAESETPNHQSAFVCLVGHMKNLINIQSTKMSSAKGVRGDGGDIVDGGSRNTRTVRTKEMAISSQITEGCNIFKSPAPASAVTKKLDIASGGKNSELSGKVKKAKGRKQKLKGAKTNIVQLMKKEKTQKTSTAAPAKDAGHPTAACQGQELNEVIENKNRRNKRKRKLTPEATSSGKSSTIPPKKDNLIVPATPTLRSMTTGSHSAKPQLDVCTTRNSQIGKRFEANLSRVGQQRVGNFSPPLTRSRLKQIMGHEQRDLQVKTLTPTATSINAEKGKN